MQRLYRQILLIAGSFQIIMALPSTLVGAESAEFYLISARAAYDAKDFLTAFSKLQPLADQGNAVAQMKLGDFYLEGQGVQKDEQQAFAWHNKAAAQGNPWAEWRVGNAYRDGRAIPKDMAAAVSWWKKAADQGHARIISIASLISGCGIEIRQPVFVFAGTCSR